MNENSGLQTFLYIYFYWSITKNLEVLTAIGRQYLSPLDFVSVLLHALLSYENPKILSCPLLHTHSLNKRICAFFKLFIGQKRDILSNSSDRFCLTLALRCKVNMAEPLTQERFLPFPSAFHMLLIWRKTNFICGDTLLCF